MQTKPQEMQVLIAAANQMYTLNERKIPMNPGAGSEPLPLKYYSFYGMPQVLLLPEKRAAGITAGRNLYTCRNTAIKRSSNIPVWELFMKKQPFRPVIPDSPFYIIPGISRKTAAIAPFDARGQTAR